MNNKERILEHEMILIKMHRTIHLLFVLAKHMHNIATNLLLQVPHYDRKREKQNGKIKTFLHRIRITVTEGRW